MEYLGATPLNGFRVFKHEDAEYLGRDEVEKFEKASYDDIKELEAENKKLKEYKDPWVYHGQAPRFGCYVLVRDGHATEIATFDQYNTWKDEHGNTLKNVHRWTYFPRTKEEKHRLDLLTPEGGQDANN